VYRAIDALLEAGVVHRLESRNAFFACHAVHGDLARQVILACEACTVVVEVDGAAIFDALARAADNAQFRPNRKVVEVTGVCRNCQSSSTAGQEGDV
jgi:Fur family transcriptional regulator, zinc uptake regulator